MAEQDRDLVLSPTQFAYVQDRTSGNVKIWTGPRADTLTANDRLVVWTGRKFIDQPDVNQARQSFVTASENQYVVLTNPSAGDPEVFPEDGSTKIAQKLDVGKRIVIPGPTSFALWPGQSADVIDGHRLSFNEYLVVQVYEPEAARKNQERAVAVPQTEGEGVKEAAKEAAKAAKPRSFKNGERIAIKGTDVSFYIPPTGIEVIVEEAEGKRGGGYVREAATLEQLEYATLVDENGEKRIEVGPKVVFPEPTEKFITERGERKFRAVELNAQSGIYVKVTADYTHDGDAVKAWRGSRMVEVKSGETLEEGDELFLTGADTPIYYPRIEHSIVLYGDRRKHHAIAVPAGEGRYDLDRTTGEVQKVPGPRMFLPDPRIEVIIRRVLEPKTVNLWYPGNQEALAVNQQLAGEQQQRGEEYLAATADALASPASAGQVGSLARSYATTGGYGGDYVKRGTEYTPPRTITLDTKYLGPPRISVWPGYAVMVLDPTGNRRVEIGQVDLQLEYHETLMALTLSTGRPKGSGNPLQTAYLRTVNNAVSDFVTVETRDLVPVALALSLRANFEAKDAVEAERWFEVEDYIALLTDNVRSRLRNLAKQHEIQEFYEAATDLVRDRLLGESKDGTREGLYFPENGMRLYDVEVDATIAEPNVRALLDGAAREALTGAIQLSQATQRAARESQLETLKRRSIDETEKTAEAQSVAALNEIERGLARSLRAIEGLLQEAEEHAKADAVARAEARTDANQEVAILNDRNAAILARAEKEVELFVTQANAIDPKLAEAIRVYGQEKVAAGIAEALGPYSLIAGGSAVDILRERLGGTMFAPVLEALSDHPMARVAAGNGGGEE